MTGPRILLRLPLLLACVACVACKAPADPDPRRGPDREPATEPRIVAAPEPAEPAQPAMLGVLAPAAQVVVVSPGFARVDRIDVVLGDHVAADQRIAVLDLHAERSELGSTTAAWKAAKSELERLELELEQARANRADVEQLEDFVSAAELRERRFAEQLAGARKRSANAELEQQRRKIDAATERLAEAELRAPFPAVVAHRYVDPGASMAAGDPVLELLSEQRLVRFAVPEQHAQRLRLGAAVEVRFDGAPGVVSARVTAIAPEIAAGTRLLFAEAQLDRELPELRVGAVARVRWPTPPASP
jgi:membrane fusion protein, multidrug efflux system